MARNGSGSYSLPVGNPVVLGTAVSSTWANTTLADLANETTDSLSRSGKGGMSAPLPLADGTVALPGLTFSNDTNTGIYRIGADNIGVAVGGAKVLDLGAATCTFTGTMAANAASVTGNIGCASATVTGDTSTGGVFKYAAAKTYQLIVPIAQITCESAASSTPLGNDATAADLPEFKITGDTAQLYASAHVPAGATITAIDAYYALTIAGASSLAARARLLTTGAAPADIIAPNTAVACATIAGGWHSLGAATQQTADASGGSDVEISLKAIIAGFPDVMDIYALRVTYTLQTIRP